jgi:IclR family KDG regulon transcriptional repressor
LTGGGILPLDESKNVTEKNTKATERQIQSVQRAINILNCFTMTNSALTLGQISNQLNLNKGTVHGILSTLYQNGYISQNGNGQYMLGAALFNKACLAAGTRQSMCIDRGHDRLLALSNQFQLNGTMFAMDEKQLRVIDTTEPTNCPFIVQRVSPQISLYDSASGKILLAYLSEKERAEYLERMPMTPFQKSFEDKQKNFDVELYRIRKNGYSEEYDALFTGVSALAVPIFNRYHNELFGSVSLTGMSPMIKKRRQEIIAALQAHARYLQDCLRF